MNRFIAILLALTLLLCSTVAFATADNDEQPRQSDYFASYGTSLTAIGSGKIRVSFSCTAVGTATTLGVANYVVQRKNSSGEWVDATGWLSGKTGSNVHTYSFSKTINGTAGTTYRVKCTFVCVKDGGVEHKSFESMRSDGLSIGSSGIMNSSRALTKSCRCVILTSAAASTSGTDT